MKYFKISKLDLNLDNKHYPEGKIFKFDEKKKIVQDLVKRGNLVETSPSEASPDAQDSAKEDAENTDGK